MKILNKKAIIVTNIAGLIVVGLYFANQPPVTSDNIDSVATGQSLLPDTSAVATDIKTSEKSTHVQTVNAEQSDHQKNDTNAGEENETKHLSQKIFNSESDRDLALAQEYGFGLPIEVDASLPPASSDNEVAKPGGEYSEQIDQQTINNIAEVKVC